MEVCTSPPLACLLPEQQVEMGSTAQPHRVLRLRCLFANRVAVCALTAQSHRLPSPADRNFSVEE